MEGHIYGDVPSEGSVSGRRFGIYRSDSPDHKLSTGSCVRVLLIFAIASAVVFAIFYPVITYTSRGNRRISSIPIPEIVNRSQGGGIKYSNSITINCSTSVFSFGNDCPEVYKPSDEIITSNNGNVSSTTEVKRFDAVINPIKTEEEDNLYLQDQAVIQDFKYQRRGRSRWPKVSTPYPYYLPQPTETPYVPTPETQTSPQTNIFAIPHDLGNGNNVNTDHSSSTVNFTPPPYAFTPFPNFTDSYAQLSPYKPTKNNSNFMDVMKYLKNIGASDRSMEGVKNEDIPQSRSTTMKVTGTYMMPLDKRRPGEIILSGPFEGMDPNAFFNGHAYVSDPFINFRPSNPSEVNRLIPIKTDTDIGPRFRKPVSFVPTSSISVDLTPPLPPLPHRNEQLESIGSHTVAIFHPPQQVSDLQLPPLIPRPTTEAPQDRPFSVTLDIFPVTMDNLSEFSDSTSTSAAPGQRVRPHPKWRHKAMERPRWRPQPHRRPTTVASAQTSPENHMVVHLNMFPGKRKSYVFPRRGRKDDSNRTEAEEQSISRTSTGEVLVGEGRRDNDETNQGSFLDGQEDGKNGGSEQIRSRGQDYPAFLALSSFGQVLENSHSRNSSVEIDVRENKTTTEISSSRMSEASTVQPIVTSTGLPKSVNMTNTLDTNIKHRVEDDISTVNIGVETVTPIGEEVETTMAVEREVRTISGVGEEVVTVSSVEIEPTTSLDTTDSYVSEKLTTCC